MEAQQKVENQTLYRVKILHSSATDVYVGSEDLKLQKDDLVVVPTRYGQELGRVQGVVCSLCSEGKAPQTVIRKASCEDQERHERHKKDEEEAFQICRSKIGEHGLDMKLVSSHCLIDEKKIIFYFTAENRVDFRELVKDLVRIFKTRIELRQIGVRDEARVLGGMGVCGRTYCCHGITDKLRAVSIKMAKEQNLTLNSMKISGPCGRLLCCLAYEYESYKEMRRKVPSEGTRLKINGAGFRVVDVNVFLSSVKLESEQGEALVLDFDRFSYDSKRGQWRVL